MPAEYADRAGPLGQYEDAAYRLSDVVQNMLATHGVDVIGKWIAVRLDTGAWQAGPADHRYELIRVIRRAHDEKRFAYLTIPPMSLSPRSAANYLKFTRQLYAAGMQIIDPDKDTEVVPVERPGSLNLYHSDLWRPGTPLARSLALIEQLRQNGAKS